MGIIVHPPAARHRHGRFQHRRAILAAAPWYATETSHPAGPSRGNRDAAPTAWPTAIRYAVTAAAGWFQ
ncbi:MAG TPA: hypothetical protein VM597_25150 [Gemmataceae bacterium]|nr:hypothetical protein [Gemmataceae bacterium]